MFKELKMKIAARRVERKKARSKKRRGAKRTTFWARATEIISYPFRKLAAFCKFVWNWIRSIDLIGLVNLTLLVAIIVLFSMLIIDVINCRRNSATVPDQVVVVETNAPKITEARTVKPRPVTLPLARDEKTNKFVAEPIQVVPPKKCAVAHNQVARTGKKLYGDIIIDNRDMAGVLERGAHVYGNVYLQNMRKYVLPCDIHIEGNLFLRDLNMLQFCGDFTITGNIYVSPRSSFGPIPRTARLGGHVIL